MFPDELSELIENKTQVYCEKCGKPFSLKGVVFKPATIQPPPPKPSREKKEVPKKTTPQGQPQYKFAEKDRDKFDNAIQHLNKYSSIPVLIVSILVLVFATLTIMHVLSSFWYKPTEHTYKNILLIIQNILLGASGLSIAVYDIKYLSPKIKEKKYNEIVVDSLCWGIVGCVVYGAGVILLIKGVAILIYNILDKKNFGHNLKNSLNNFSATLGFIIILLAIKPFFFQEYNTMIELTWWIITVSLALIALYIDLRYKKEIHEKREFLLNDAVLFFILGILGVMYAAAGIFILLKGILFFFLIYIKPPEEDDIVVLKPVEEKAKDFVLAIKIDDPKDKIEEPSPIQIIEPQEIELSKKQVKEIKEHAKKTEKLKKDLEKKPTIEKEIELRLHESLLPVKDEKDKELVKHYFKKIFAVLSKELKNQINDLGISKKEKKELLKELAFLTQEEQVKYIESIVDLYQEIPKKLIVRIKKLPNVKPKHYDKIVEQLKYLDVEEQVKFVQYLEEHA